MSRAGAVRRADAGGAAKDRLRLWLRLLRTTRGIEAELRRRLRLAFGTTLPRFDVMSAIARAPQGTTMGALSRQLLVSNGNVTGIVERLVADGLVVRTTPAGDRRQQLVRLTPEGQRLFGVMATAHEAWVDEILGSLDASRVAQMSAMLAHAADRGREQPSEET